MKKQSKYFNLAKQNMTRKIVSSFLDGLLLLIFNIVLVLTVVFPILRNNEEFKKNNDRCFEEINQIYLIHEEAKVNFLVEGSKKDIISKEELFDIYVDQNLNTCYQYNINLFNEQGITINLDSYASFDNDILAYYFVNYKNENKINILDYNNKDSKVYYVESILYKNINKDYFDLVDGFPVIKFEKAINIYNYKKGLSNDHTLYNEFYNAFIKINQMAIDDLSTYSEYKDHFNKYQNAFFEMSKMENIALFILYVVTFIILILLPQLIFKEGITFGRLITKTRLCSNDGSEASTKQILVGNISTFMVFGVVIIFTSLFTFGLTNLSLTLFSIGELSISYLQILMLSILMIFINFAFICFNFDHFTFSEFISKMQSKDLTYYIKENNN